MGGGLVIVPVLIFSFNLQGIGGELVAHMAVGTSLATIMFTSLSAIHTHHQRRAIDWKLAAMLSAGIVIGAWLGDTPPTTCRGCSCSGSLACSPG
ncbi:sulfite exporter TauE/SafE family protein [Oceanimonas sp. NS1]|nr:sulfite exporter TauE/SafE family protein [Oceanimonas sp. NS1]